MRLTYTADPPQFSDPGEQAILTNLLEHRSAVGYGLGPIYRTLLLSPTFAHGFTEFFKPVRYATRVPDDVKELAMCRVGALNGAAFEWMHHAPVLLKSGVSGEGVETVRVAKAGEVVGAEEGGEKEVRGLSPRFWRVMRYVDAMTKEVVVSDEVFEGMRREMGGDREVVELTLTICGYNAISRLLRALDVAEMKDVEVGKAKAKL